MDSMKTKFYKKLVPLALIASLASTNVGLTSVAVNAQTPQAVYSTSMDEADFDLVGNGETVTYATEAQVNALKDGSVDTQREVTGVDGTDGFKYYYSYGGTEAEITANDVAVGSYAIKFNSEDAKASDFIGREDLFEITGTGYSTANVSIKISEIKKTDGDSSSFPYGGIKLTIVSKATAINFTTAASWTVKVKTSSSASTAILLLNATGKKIESPRTVFAENKTGVAGKFFIRETQTGYALYRQTASTDASGTVTYAPSSITGVGDTYSSNNALICNLTPEQVANLPFTQAKPATKAEYEALKEDTDAIEGGLTKKDYDDNFANDTTALLKDWLKSVKTAAGGDAGTAKTNAENSLVEIFNGLTTQRSAGIAELKTTIASDNTENNDKTNIKKAKIKALYNELKKTNSSLAMSGTEIVAHKDNRVDPNEDGTGTNLKKATDLEFLKAIVADTNKIADADAFYSWATNTNNSQVGLGSETSVWDKLTGKSEYNASVGELDWQNESDVSTYAKAGKIKLMKADIGSDGASAKYAKDSSVYATQKTTFENQLLADKYSHKKVLIESGINWVTETVNAKGATISGASFAKFQVTKNDKTSFAAKTTGAEAIIGATKANGKYNSYVTVKAVSSDYKAASGKNAQKGKVYAESSFYVTPEVPTGYTDVSLGKTTDKGGVTFAAPESNATTTGLKTYSLTMDEGKSFKIPFVLKNGSDKTLAYDVSSNATGFTVVNGTVKAIAGGGTGTITVYPAALGNLWTSTESTEYDPAKVTAIQISVTTNAAVKSVKANTNRVTMYPGAVQYVSFGTSPASFGTYKYEVSGLDKYTTTWVKDTTGAVDADPKKNTILKIESPSTLTDETTPDKVTKATIKIKNADGTEVEGVRDCNFTVAWAGAGANAKSVKETYKKVGTDGTVEINIPVGGVVNLGASVNPATADQTIHYGLSKTKVGLNHTNKGTAAVAYVEGDCDGDLLEDYTEVENNGTPSKADYATTRTNADKVTTEVVLTGDVLKGETEGTYYVKGWTVAKNDANEELTTNIYKVNVYTPGSSVIMLDERDNPNYDTDDVTEAWDDHSGQFNAATTGPLSLKKSDVYTIVGGQLISKADAETSGSKTIMGGQTITIGEPFTLGAKEEIEWKCNNPSAIRITKGADYHVASSFTAAGTRAAGSDLIYSTLNLDLCQAGTFTITGTTKYTNQRYAFKVTVGSDTTKKKTDITANSGKGNMYFKGVDLLATSTSAAMNAGETANVNYFTAFEGLAGKVKFEAVDKKVLSVSGSGVVKATGAGTTQIKATFTSTDGKTNFTVTSNNITVSAKKAEITKFIVPAGVTAGKDFNVNVAVKNVKLNECNVTWDCVEFNSGKSIADITSDNIANPGTTICKSATFTNLASKTSAPVKISAAGKYLVRFKIAPKTGATNENTVYAYTQVDVFTKAPDVVNVTNNDAAAKKAIASLAAAPKADPDHEGQTIGGAGYGVYIIPVFATAKTDGTIDVGDIEWTSSNNSLATAVALTPADTANAKADMATYLATANSGDAASNLFAAAVDEENAIVKSAKDAYGFVKIITAKKSTGLTGKVTLTGVLKNSGKKVTITLNIKNEDKSVTDKYNPIKASNNTAKTGLTSSTGFQNVAALKGETYNQDDIDKLGKGKVYTYYEYVLVDTDNVNTLKTKPADHIKVKNTYSSTGAASGGLTVANGVITDVPAISAGGTYYLAQVAVSVKVKKAATVENDSVTEHAELETTPTKQVVTIASSTPYIVPSAS
jgi:hypothetical protein